jgi:hypothetical protein
MARRESVEVEAARWRLSKAEQRLYLAQIDRSSARWELRKELLFQGKERPAKSVPLVVSVNEVGKH